jgi:hypothetical protein
MVTISSSSLENFYSFFETYGTQRLNGLNSSVFQPMTLDERAEAWNYLADKFELSDERIHGLYVMDATAAVDLFKKAIAEPLKESPYPATKQAMQNSRVLMMRYVCAQEPTNENINALLTLIGSEFPQIRKNVAQSLPTNSTTPEAVSALKSMIVTETDDITLSVASIKLMAMHGMDFDARDPVYKSIYSGLASDDTSKKNIAISRLASKQQPGYV